MTSVDIPIHFPPPVPTLLEDMKAYIGFGVEDTERLRAFRPAAAPHFSTIADHFYRQILEHPSAHAAITGGSPQVERLKTTLAEWMDSGLAGPHDEAFWERRCRIGRMHVRIGLPQRYMFTAMNVMRLDFRHVVHREIAAPEVARPLNDSLDKLFDLELAIMLHTYQEDSEDRLRRRERLATIGQLAATIGHDLRNPLGVIQSSLYIIRKRTVTDERMLRHLEKIGAQVEHCNSIVTDLLEMARNRPPKSGPVDIGALIEECVSLISPRLGAIEIVREIEPDIDLHGDAGLLRQVLVNLLGNAITAIDERGGHVFVRARQNAGTVELSVEDDGPGFDPDVLPNAFEPLVTTRAKGTGLGLALVRGIIERHGGSVVALNRPIGGAAVVIRLPQRPAQERT